MDVIQVKDVTKKFRIYYDKGGTLKEKILFRNRNKYEDRWVLKGINLNIKKGETVGLIGENGSGKSTLLKLLTRIIYPDNGEIKINGKVSSLLELGAGFHPDMTGRENIYMNASIFGLTKEEIDRRLDDIIAFSELEEFIDNPVRTYSSGMYMRLAFSVAINVEAEILLIDEILAVGDAAFQKKCFDKISELKNMNKTVVIVSHDTNNLKKLCDKVIWLSNGKISTEGESEYIISEYMEHVYKNRRVDNKADLAEYKNENKNSKDNDQKDGYLNENQKLKNTTPARWGAKEIEFTHVELLNRNNIQETSYKYGDKLIIKMRYKVNENVKNIVFGFGMFLPDGTRCYGTNTELDGLKIDELKKDEEGSIVFSIENLFLTNGIYNLNLAVHAQDGYIYDYLNRMYSINVYSNSTDIGIFKPNHNWIFN